MILNAANIAHTHPTALLQQLLRFDTTNPPGNEKACIDFIADTMTKYEIDVTLYAKDPHRPNLVARLQGSGNASPLLLYGHVDVVTTSNQRWSHAPFSGKLVDGWIWGRGALDMKGGIAMMLTAFLRAKANNVDLPGDIIFLALADEEAGGHYGARFMVREHPEVFDGVRYAIGEFGGFSLDQGGSRFYPIMISEKVVASLRLTIRGPGGHGSLPMRGGTMANVSKVLQRLDQQRLPAHLTSGTAAMLRGMASGLEEDDGRNLQLLLTESTIDSTLDAMGHSGRIYDALLHNTATATVIRGGDKFNVVPSEVTIDIDGRLLPGFHPKDLVKELALLLGDMAEIEILTHDPPGPDKPNMGLFPSMVEILNEVDPTGIPIPLVMYGATDGRFLNQLGVQTYGFLPMNFPTNFDFSHLLHAADERIPAASLDFGSEALFRLLTKDRD